MLDLNVEVRMDSKRYFTVEEANSLVPALEDRFGSIAQLFNMPLQHRISRHSEGVEAAGVFGEIEQVGLGEVSVAAKRDSAAGKSASELADQRPKKCQQPTCASDITGAKTRAEQHSALALEHQYRMVHVTAVEAAVESELLLAVCGVFGGVDVQDDLLRRWPSDVATKPLGTLELEAPNRFPAHGILQSRQGRLRGQRRLVSPHHCTKSRISPQERRVVSVLVPGSDLVDPLSQQVSDLVRDVAPITLVTDQAT